MNQFALKLPVYEGPLEKLLELIEERTLDVSQLSLAAVTDEFITYLEGLADVPPALLADFIVVASRLILIKSKSLLPSLALTEEEERDIEDLESRLRLYKQLKGTQKYVAESWGGEARALGRAYFMEFTAPAVFYPGRNTTVPNLEAALRSIYESLKKLHLETETITEQVVSLEERMREIVKRMEALAETSLAALSEGRPRAEVIVAFLAILHLAKEQLVRLEQGTHFSDIIIRKSPSGAPTNE